MFIASMCTIKAIHLTAKPALLRKLLLNTIKLAETP